MELTYPIQEVNNRPGFLPHGHPGPNVCSLLSNQATSEISSPEPCAGEVQTSELTKGQLGNLRQHLSGEDTGQAPEALITLSTMSFHLATGLKWEAVGSVRVLFPVKIQP